MQGGGRHGIAQEERRIRAGGVVKSWGMVGKAGEGEDDVFRVADLEHVFPNAAR